MIIRNFSHAGWLSRAVWPIVLIAFAACGGGGSSTPGLSPPILPVTRIDLAELRPHTALSAGAASYAGSAVTTPETPTLTDTVGLFYSDAAPSEVEFKRDGNLDGDFADEEDIEIIDTTYFEHARADKALLLKKGLKAGLYRLSYTLNGAATSRYIDVAPALFVDDAGSGNGSSWANAYNGATDLQALLDAVASAATDAPIIVKMKAGVYKPHASDSSVSLSLREKVRIYGGYSGSEEADSPSLGGSVEALQGADDGVLTIFSGDLNGDDEAVTENMDGSLNFSGVTDNSHHVFWNRAATPDSEEPKLGFPALLSGAKVTGGVTDESSPNGAGMLNEGYSPKLSSLIFVGNSAIDSGGAIYNGEGGATYGNEVTRPELYEVVFDLNSARKFGGALCNVNASPTLTGGSFSSNSAFHGGAIYNSVYSAPTLAGVTFSSNSALSHGGAIYSRGLNGDGLAHPKLTDVTFISNRATNGGAMASDNYSNSTLTNVVFSGNVATEYGGAMENKDHSHPRLTGVEFEANRAKYGGAMANNYYSYPTLTDVKFTRNIAVNGGAMLNEAYSDPLLSHSYSGPTLTNVTFDQNGAAGHGGAMVNSFSNASLTDVSFTGNSAGSHGGAMMNIGADPTLTRVTFSSNSADLNGGAIHNTSRLVATENNRASNPTLKNVEFDSNSAGAHGGAMYNTSCSDPRVTDSTFSNNSAAGHGGAVYNQAGYPRFCVSPTFERVVYVGNSATMGGAIYNGPKSAPRLTSVVFNQNEARSHGGAMHNDGSSPMALRALFIANTAGVAGGAMSNWNSAEPTMISSVFSGNQGRVEGNSLSFDSSSNKTVVVNTIFWDTSTREDGSQNANHDGGIQHVERMSEDDPPLALNPLLVYNSIALDNPKAEALELGASDNVVKSGDGADLFVDLSDPDGADDTWLTGDDGLRLSPSATEAINKGLYVTFVTNSPDDFQLFLSDDDTNWKKPGESETSSIPSDYDSIEDLTKTDILGNARVGRPDIGAYERQSQ